MACRAEYAESGLPVVILAGERYGTGSSRDWAAKGAQMLGARAVLAKSFERIHRANLIGMGVLPLRLPLDWSAASMRIAASDLFEIDLDLATLAPRATIGVRLRRHAGGAMISGEAVALLDTAHDVEMIRAGGIIPMILRRALKESS
jgi:aconitate hydratase